MTRIVAKYFPVASRNGNVVVAILNRLRKLPPDSELRMASGQGNLRHIESPTYITYILTIILTVVHFVDDRETSVVAGCFVSDESPRSFTRADF